MGNLFAKKLAYYVEDTKEERIHTMGFSPNAFNNFEWASLKAFCRKRSISQADLNLTFQKHCMYKDSHVADYRMKMGFIKEHFVKGSRLYVVRVY
jgi:hypothetical protein